MSGYRVVELSANTGRCLRVYGHNFRTEREAYDYAVEGLGLPALDLDAPLAWSLSLNRYVTIDNGAPPWKDRAHYIRLRQVAERLG